MAASVWMASVVSKHTPAGAWISRLSWETTPTDSDPSSPNGLPMAATGSPTWSVREEPRGRATRFSCAGGTCSTATSSNRS